MPIERKYERDVDLLLAEEFAVNPVFAERFKALTKFLKRSTQNLQLSTSSPADYPIYRVESRPSADMAKSTRLTQTIADPTMFDCYANRRRS